jgi:hypothetical protein
MSDYDGQSNCEKHGARRCMACSAGSRPKITKPEYKEMLLTGPAPTEITGAPPNIEDMTSDALRAEIASNVSPGEKVWVNDGYGDYWEEVPVPAVKSEDELGRRPGASREVPTFDALPIDDSHASKVLRAAAAYAKTAGEYAKHVARVEKIKQDLLKTEAELSEAAYKHKEAETELARLVNGENE